jgi:hypothetical protein
MILYMVHILFSISSEGNETISAILVCKFEGEGCTETNALSETEEKLPEATTVAISVEVQTKANVLSGQPTVEFVEKCWIELGLVFNAETTSAASSNRTLSRT